MVIRIRLYRGHDDDLYALYLTVGSKLFQEILKASLRSFFQLPGSGVRILPGHELILTGDGRRIAPVTLKLMDGDPLCTYLESITPGMKGLFLKNVMKDFLLREMPSVYFNSETEGFIHSAAQTASAPSVEPRQISRTVKPVQKKPKVKAVLTSNSKNVSSALDTTSVQDAATNIPVSSSTPSKNSSLDNKIVEDQTSIAPAEESSTTSETTTTGSGFSDLMGLIGDLKIT